MNQNHIAIFVIAVGSLVPNSYLLELTNDPARIFTVKDWTELGPKLLQDIENATCCPANFTTPTPPHLQCDKIDLIFLLDESDTVLQTDPTNWDTLKFFILNLTTDIFTINPRNTRLGVVGYGLYAVTQVQLGLEYDKYDWRSMVQGMKFLGGARNVQAGFVEAIDQIKRFGRPDVHTFVVHIVDYAHDILADDPTNGARELGKMNVTMYTEAIMNLQWDDVFQNETKVLTGLAYQGSPFKSKAFNVTNYSMLNGADQLRNEFINNVLPFYQCMTTPSSGSLVRK